MNYKLWNIQERRFTEMLNNNQKNELFEKHNNDKWNEKVNPKHYKLDDIYMNCKGELYALFYDEDMYVMIRCDKLFDIEECS